MSEDRRVLLAGDVLTHEVAWADNAGGYTRCGLDFAWRALDLANDFYTRINARVVAAIATDDCDCMTCLVRFERTVNFTSYQDIGVSVINVESVSKLEFFDKE